MSLTNLLVLVNVLAYLWEVAVGGGPNYAGALIAGPSFIPGALYGPDVTMHGAWWEIVSSAFLHGSLIHITLNMLALYQVGNLIERIYGKWRFALLYALSLLGASFSVIAFNYGVPTLGASGAIFGLFGALVAVGVRMGKRGGDLIRQVLPIVVINLIFTFSVPGISAAAHVGGLLTGFVAGLLLFMVPSRQREAMYAYAYPAAADPNAVETIEQPPEAAAHEEEGTTPLELRDPRE